MTLSQQLFPPQFKPIREPANDGAAGLLGRTGVTASARRFPPQHHSPNSPLTPKFPCTREGICIIRQCPAWTGTSLGPPGRRGIHRAPATTLCPQHREPRSRLWRTVPTCAPLPPALLLWAKSYGIKIAAWRKRCGIDDAGAAHT